MKRRVKSTFEKDMYEVAQENYKKRTLSIETQEYLKSFLNEYDLVEECVEGATDKVGDELLAWVKTKQTK